MTFLPGLLRLRIPRWPTLWLPLFLLWPLVLVMFVVLWALVFVLEQRSSQQRSSVFACLGGVWRLLCATRGTSVDVDAPSGRVCVSIY
jgi:hypothetical protein